MFGLARPVPARLDLGRLDLGRLAGDELGGDELGGGQGPGGLLHRRGRGELRVHDAEFVQPPGADQHPALQRTHRLVVGRNGRGQRPAQPVHVPSQAGDPVVKLAAEVKDGAGVFRQRLLLPGVLRRAQHRDQRGGSGDVHPAGERVLQQPGVAFQRRGQERLARNEQDHELRRRAQRRPVRLGRQPVHVLAQVPGVRVRPGRPHVVALGFHRFQVGGERHLRVHHDVLAASQPHHHVRPQRAVRTGHGDLLVEVAARAHSGQLDHPAQLQLTPAAPGFGPPQRGDQRLGLGAQLLGTLPGDTDLLGERGVRPGPVGVGLPQLGLDPGQGVLQRPDQVLDRRAAGLELTGRGRVRRLQPALRDLEEARGARVERLRGQRLEPLRELSFDQRGPVGRAPLDHPGSVLGGPGPLIRGPGTAGSVRGSGGETAAGEQVSDRCPDADPEQ